MGDPVDLRKMIDDWYVCPLCGKTIVGFMSWASHTAQVHGMYWGEFVKKYGEEKYFYGITKQEEAKWNPSRRNLQVEK